MASPSLAARAAILGVPYQPNKRPDPLGVVKAIEALDAKAMATSAGAIVRDTKALLDAVVNPPAHQMGWVTGDATAANNGIYENAGSPSAPNWQRRADLPHGVIHMINVGAGTADSIVATSSLPAPVALGAALFTVNIVATNTGPVTVNGKPLRTNSGNELVPDGLVASSMPVFVDLGDHYRLLSDQASAAIVAAAESAADRAEGFAAMLSSDKVSFATVPLLLADELMSYTDEPGKIHVGPGDRFSAGGYPYEVATSDALDWHVENANGVKIRALPGDRGIWLEQLGVVFDGATDSTSRLQQISASLASYRGILSAGAGVCKLNGTFEVPRHASFICDGAVFDANGSAGSFDTAVILKRGAIPERIADLSANGLEFDDELKFASAHGLSAGDTIILFNPTDGSFYAGRPVYREGQFAKVAEVVSPTIIRVDRELYATHSRLQTEVYLCQDMASGDMKGFTAIAPGAGTGNGIINGWRVEYAEGVHLKQTASRGSDGSSAVMRLGFRCSGAEQDEHQIGANPGFGTQYGFSVANCQECRFSGGTFEGNRHGIALGGFSEFSIPNREVHVSKFIAKNHDGALAAADWHGNVEYCSYEDGTCYGGAVNIAGDRNKIRNITVHGDDNCFGLFGREIVGMSHRISNVEIFAGRQDSNRGVGLDIGGDSVAFGANCRRGGMLDVSNLTVHARNQDRRIIRVTNRGFVGDPWSVRVRGLTVHMPNAEETFALVHVSAQGGADQPQSVEATSIEALDMPVARKLGCLADATVPLRLDDQSGMIELTTSTGVSAVNSDPQYYTRLAYPRAPHAQASMVGNSVDGANKIGVYITSVSSSNIRVGISRTDGTGNFGGAVTRQVCWKVGIRDF